MATSFDDAFAGYGAAAEDPNAVPGVDPNVGVMPANGGLPLGVDPSQVGSAGVQTDPGGGYTNAMQAGAPAPPAYAANPDSYMAAPGTGSTTPAIPDGRDLPRHSLIGVLHNLGNIMAVAGGRPTYQDSRIATYQAQQQAALNQQKTAADIAGTGVQTQTASNDLLHGFAQGLQQIQKQGGDPAIAAPQLARQMGLSDAQAQTMIANYKTNPNYFDAVVSATDPSKAGGGGAHFANVPLFTRDAQGNLHVNQLSNAGGMSEATLPAGQHVVLPGITQENLGTQEIGRDKLGNIIYRDTKDGTPEAGTGVAAADAQGRPTAYRAIPGSPAALNMQKTQSEINAANTKASGALQTQQTSWDATMNEIQNMNRSINVLEKNNTQPSAGQNGIANGLNYMGGSAAGQALAHVTNPAVAAARDQLKASAAALIAAAAHGQSRMFASNTEQQRFMNMMNNPQSSISVMRDALKSAAARAGPRPGNAAPGWGPVTVQGK